MTIAKAHHYAIDAATLLETCLARLRETIALDRRKRAHQSLVDMKVVLVTTERLLLAYICQQIDLEREIVSHELHMDEEDSEHEVPPTLLECIEIFRSVLEVKKQRQMRMHEARLAGGSSGRKDRNVTFASNLVPSGERTNERMHATHQQPNSNGSKRPTFDHSRSPVDSLLFRLIVALQLCLVRIDDARFVITGHRHCDDKESIPEESSLTVLKVGVASTVCVIGIGSLWMLRSKSNKPSASDNAQTSSRGMLRISGKVALVAFTGKILVREWGYLWMTAKIIKSTAAVEEWQQQWLLVQTAAAGGRRGSLTSPDAKSQRLIEYAMSQSPKSSLWHSEGEIRFLLLKRAMDLLYASVGTAVEATKNTEATKEGRIGWKLPIAAAAAASYYSLIDPSRRASEAVSSSSFDLIQYAWGMVSLPAIKQLSLKASRLLKGAAIAERITIAGVPCFILSRDPSPDLAAALMREKRRRRNNKRKSDLSTIEESVDEQDTSSSPLLKSKKQAMPSRSYPKKDIILHFTGGGFFAHTLASDIPFLLDWSGKTNAIVISPEYSLLPENRFPVALHEVTKVYCSLVSGESSDLLGMDADRVIVTGESAGGNLAAAMCVKLCTENLVGAAIASLSDEPFTETEASATEESNHEINGATAAVRLPDAIMLSCPALNLTLDLSPSRVVGQQDPVLPSGLISAISDAYAPPMLGVNKRDPLVSPLYAPDDVLRLFPPILLFASSEDPLLDDSVDFNRRCRSLGVESELGAVSHMPHAYLGLGTAGFPEAQQVQHECEEWLVRQLSRGTKEKKMGDEETE